MYVYSNIITHINVRKQDFLDHKCSKLNEKYEIARKVLKCDYIRYSPSEISKISTAISQIYINIPGEDSVISLLNSYPDLNFDVLHAATNNRCADNNDKKLVNLGPIALFSVYKLTKSSRKHSEDIKEAHIVCLMYKLITTAKGCDDLCIGFDRKRTRRQRELTNNKNIKDVRKMLKVVYGFAEYHEKSTFGLDYKLTVTKNTDSSVLNKSNAIKNAISNVIAIEWYVPHYTPSISNQAILCN